MKYKIKKMLILTIIGTGISIPSNAQKIYNQQKNSGLQTKSLGFQKDQRIWNSNSQKKLKQSLSIFKGSDSSDYADSSNVKGLYAGLFFGISTLNFNFNDEPIQISQLGYEHEESIEFHNYIYVPNDITATVDAGADAGKYNMDAGLNLGYFPGFLTFNLGEEKKLGFGAVSKLGLSFHRGFGGWFSIGPEVAYRHNAWTFRAGYEFSYALMDYKVGNLQLEGADRIVTSDLYWMGDPPEPDFEGQGAGWIMHNEESVMTVSGTATMSVPYLKIGYSWKGKNPAGIGLVIGYRAANNRNATYQLTGPHEKIGNAHISQLRGPEFDGLENTFDFSGLFIQIELFTFPF